MSDKFIGLGGLIEYNKQLIETYIKSLENKVDRVSNNYVTTDTEQEITAIKRFKNAFVVVENDSNPDGYSIIFHDSVYVGETNDTYTKYKDGKIVNNIPFVGEVALTIPKKSGTFALTSDIPTDYLKLDADEEQEVSTPIIFTGENQYHHPQYFWSSIIAEAGIDLYDNYSNPLCFLTGDGFIDINDTNIILRLPYTTDDNGIRLKPGTLATIEDLPDTSKLVTTDTRQTITADKVFYKNYTTEEELEEGYDYYREVVLNADGMGILDSSESDVPIEVSFTSYGMQTYDPHNGIYKVISTDFCLIHAEYDAAGDVFSLHLPVLSDGDIVNVVLPEKSGTLALTSDIPTNYVTTDTEQTITGRKIFTDGINDNVGYWGIDYDGSAWLRTLDVPFINMLESAAGDAGIFFEPNADASILADPSGLYVNIAEGSVHSYNYNTEVDYSAIGIFGTYTENDWDTISEFTYKIPRKAGIHTLALTSDIPTNYVTTDTEQQIFGHKYFSAGISNGGVWGIEDTGSAYFADVTVSSGIRYISLDPQVGIGVYEGVDSLKLYTNKIEYHYVREDGTGDYTFNFPEKSGTFALASDIPNTKSTLFSLCNETTGTYIYGVVPNVIITTPAQLVAYLSANNIYDTTTSSMRFPVSGVSISGGHVYSVISICLNTSSNGLVLKVGGNGGVMDTAITVGSDYKWNFKQLIV